MFTKLMENNLWFKNGYRIGDVLVGCTCADGQVSVSAYVITDFHQFDRTYAPIKDKGVIHFTSNWMRKCYRFKAQDYINDLDSPTTTELSLIQLQFPEIDINMILEQIKELREGTIR